MNWDWWKCVCKQSSWVCLLCCTLAVCCNLSAEPTQHCDDMNGFHFVNSLSHSFFPLCVCVTGKGEEIHASSGQPEDQRRRERLHVQQTHLRYLQHGAKVWCDSAHRASVWPRECVMMCLCSMLFHALIQERLQRPAADRAGVRFPGGCWQLESLFPPSRRVPWERSGTAHRKWLFTHTLTPQRHLFKQGVFLKQHS